MKNILSRFRMKEIHLFWICLIFGLFLIYFIFIRHDLIRNPEQKITFIIASFGILFSILQFWYNSIRHRNDFLRNMGYEEYKRIRELTNRFFNALYENMQGDQNIHLLSRQLVNLKNEISAIIRITNKSIFKGILENDYVKEFGVKSESVVLKTDELRAKLDKLFEKKEALGNLVDFEIEVEKMNWHNEIRDIIKELYELKYHVFEFMEKKLVKNYGY
ncbi:MAG: hypothetical protein IH598_16575 [Bacteroidales bacterium]|nr:hypothetical protein [Bacteroidales bacterium]